MSKSNDTVIQLTYAEFQKLVSVAAITLTQNNKLSLRVNNSTGIGPNVYVKIGDIETEITDHKSW